MSKKKKRVSKIRARLSEEDILILLEIRGLKKNPFAVFDDGKSAPCYRPRITKVEMKKIDDGRTAKQKIENAIPEEYANYIRKIIKNQSLTSKGKINLIAKHCDIDEKTIYDWATRLSLTISSSQFSLAKQHVIPKSKRYIISSAQNSCPVNMSFLKNIEAYAKFIGAEIGIIATRYQNPTSVWYDKDEDWDKAVTPYLTAKRHTLHTNLELVADLKIQATAPNPTNGIELFGAGRSCIVGAPKIEMRSLPVLDGEIQKFLHSTGTVTMPSFTDTVAGGKAAEHHSYGFIVVEIESEDVVHIRNVSAHNNGSFNDLWFRVDDGNIEIESVDTMVFGDSHFAQKDDDVTIACQNMCSDFSVKTAVLHDVFDSESMNIHNVKNPVVMHKLAMEGKDDFEAELNQMYSELQWFEDNVPQTIVVASNHDDMLDRAMVAYHWNDNMKNAKIFVEMLALKLSGKADDGLIQFKINERFKKIHALSDEDSYTHHGVELGLHGHIGANGSRGNINGFSKLSTKTIIAHSHSPAIKGGCYQVGLTCSMKHGYNRGLSGWAYANCLLNKHGKRQMIVLNKDTLGYTTLQIPKFNDSL